MESEKRFAEGYEITQSILIGDKEIVFGIDDNKRMPFFCAYCTENEFFEQYTEAMIGDDYAEMVGLYAQCIKEQSERLQEDRNSITVEKEIITAEMCIPDYGDKCIEGKVVAIKPSALRHEYRTADCQLILCTGG